MYTFEHSITTKAKPATIWGLYADITSWTAWDDSIEHAALDGPFVAGARGVVQPQGQDTLSFQLINVEPLRGFSDVTAIPDAGIEVRFVHRLQKTLDGTRITHAVSIAEHLGPPFIAEVSPGIPRTMERLAALAIDREREHAG